MKKTVSIILTLFLLLCFVSCEENISPKSREFYYYFDTMSTVYDYTGMSEERFSALCSDVEDKMLIYHKYFDIYNEYTGVVNLATINKTEGKIQVDRELFDFLKHAKEMYNLTRGEVNVAFGSVLSIWHDYREQGKSVPAYAELSAANLHTDIEKLALYEDTLSVERLDTGLLLDAGALAKGYACEKIGEYVREKYGEGIVLDFGGNLKCVGAKPNGSGWKSGVRNPDPFAVDPYVHTFEIKNASAVTSGVYERYYVVDGVSYHHIIDKDTLFPKNDYLSVSIICPSAAMADALSTAFFNMESSEISEVLSGINEKITVIIIHKNGEKEIIE